MQVRDLFRPDITVSLIGHVLLVELVILSAGVHPFSTRSAEPITVDLVTAQEADRKPVPTPQPSPASAALTTQDMSAGPTNPFTPAAAATPPSAPENPGSPQAAASPPVRTAAAPPRSLGYVPPEPDITIKYHVMLGLPQDLPQDAAPPSSADSSADGGDGSDAVASDLASDVVAAFRHHLKTCSKLPPSVTPADSFTIKLQVVMRPDGALAAEPSLVEGPPPSQKVFDFRDSVVRAIVSCAPYTMLPPDRYGEWKVLHFSLTPRDFAS